MAAVIIGDFPIQQIVGSDTRIQEVKFTLTNDTEVKCPLGHIVLGIIGARVKTSATTPGVFTCDLDETDGSITATAVGATGTTVAYVTVMTRGTV